MAIGHGAVMKVSGTILVIVLMVAAVLAQGFYLWAASLTFSFGPRGSPTLEQGLLISRTTSTVFLMLSVATGLVARAYALAATAGVWALLMLINTGLWLLVALPGLAAVLVLGILWLVRSPRRNQTDRDDSTSNRRVAHTAVVQSAESIVTSRRIVIAVVVGAVLAQGLYLWAFWLMVLDGSPSQDPGPLIAGATSAVLLALAIAAGVFARAYALAIVTGVWALLLLIDFGLWTLACLPGLVAVLVLGILWLQRARRFNEDQRQPGPPTTGAVGSDSDGLSNGNRS